MTVKIVAEASFTRKLILLVVEVGPTGSAFAAFYFSCLVCWKLERAPGSLDEMAVANLTYQFRVDNDPMFRGLSYPPVIATGSNTAIPMYVPTNATNKVIEDNNLLIIDSGAHYLGAYLQSRVQFFFLWRSRGSISPDTKFSFKATYCVYSGQIRSSDCTERTRF